MARPAPVLYFELVGEPHSQGSKSIGRRKDGVAYVREDDPQLKGWRANLALLCRSEMHRRGVLQLSYVALALEFGYPRPASHFKSHRGQPSTVLKDWALPLYYARDGRDVDKMTRAVLDGLKDGGLYPTDKRVVDFLGGPRRVYADYHYARVWVWDAEALERTHAEAVAPTGPTKTESSEEGSVLPLGNGV